MRAQHAGWISDIDEAESRAIVEFDLALRTQYGPISSGSIT